MFISKNNFDYFYVGHATNILLNLLQDSPSDFPSFCLKGNISYFSNIDECREIFYMNVHFMSSRVKMF